MARKQPNDLFLEYEEDMVANPAYAGMPDLRWSDGRIQWEAPSNRNSGEYRFTHDRRMAWWENKASEIGISTNEAHWISKVAKTIHPTKRKPCKICGRIMDIRYAYLSSNFMKAVRKLPYVDDQLEMDECTHITDFVVEFEELYGSTSLDDLRAILKCKVMPLSTIPHFTSSSEMVKWLDDVYIPLEPKKLGPGAMSNPPDRLDGFHTYNRCCRSKEDKGRSKENLASYSTDRRAFEYWVDGNWIQANKSMGLFRSDREIKSLPCLNSPDGGAHPHPCDADHIGPISLGFAHRPVFQPLCTTCNSAKNNRMYLTDVAKLIKAEETGEQVVTWYAKAVWDELKGNVSTPDDAVKLSRIMRDNRHNAMKLLGRLLADGHLLFLSTLLGLSCANYSYSLVSWTQDEAGTISFAFDAQPSDLKYKQIQKYRRLRVGFQALRDYNTKDNRNWFSLDLSSNQQIYPQLLDAIKSFEADYPTLNESLADFYLTDFADAEAIKEIVDLIPSADELTDNSTYVLARGEMQRFMDNIGAHLASMWEDPRYARDVYEDYDL